MAQDQVTHEADYAKVTIYDRRDHRVPFPADREIDVLGAYVHGALSALHLLGVIYNLRRGNKGDCVVHGCALLYDAHATYVHWKAAQE